MGPGNASRSPNIRQKVDALCQAWRLAALSLGAILMVREATQVVLLRKFSRFEIMSNAGAA